MSDKTPITNRRGQTMYVRFEKTPGEQRGLAIYQHGYSGGADDPRALNITKVFRNNGFDTLTLDCTHTFNESDGELEGNTIETHLHDLYDAIEWAKEQEWFSAPFALAGHSLGGFTTLHYAENHPEDVSLLCPLAAVISGKHLYEAYERNMPESEFAAWRDNGEQVRECTWKETEPSKQPFSWLSCMAPYTILEDTDKLTMPVLMIVGEHDIPTPPDHQRVLFDLLNCEREMHIIAGSDHPFTAPEHSEEMAFLLDGWLKRY